MLTKISCVVLISLVSPVLLYDLPYRYPNYSPPINRRSYTPEGLSPFYSYGNPNGTPYVGPYRYETPQASFAGPQYTRPVRSTGPVASPKSDYVFAPTGKRPQRAPVPKFSKFTLEEASAGYFNLPQGFQNTAKPTGFVPGHLFTAYKYGPAAAHVPLNSLAGATYYGQASNSNRGPVTYPDSQTEKPIEEPLQEVPVSPTPVAELTKAAVLHQHMFSSPSTAKPVEVTPQSTDSRNVEYEIKYVPVYVDEESGKEVKSEELSNYRLKYEVDSAKSYVPTPTKSSITYKYVPSIPYASVAAPSATSYKYESQKFIPSGYESSVSSLDGHEKDYPHYAPKYEFGYRVHDSYTGSDFGQSEHRDGEVTKGSYHVLLPDGRHQTVNYWSDDSGFHAKVKYDGVAKHYPAPTKASYEHSLDSNSIHS